MGYLLKREFRYRKTEVVKDTLMMLAVPVLCMIICMMAKDYMRTLGEYIYMVPEPVYRLFGIAKTDSYNYWFYIKIVIIFSNVYVMWNLCNGVFYDVGRDEKNGTVFFMCNQLYTRKTIILSKYIASTVSYVIMYILWFLGMMLAGVVSRMNMSIITGGIKEMLTMMYGGIIVGILFLSVMFIYAVYDRRKDEYRASVFAGSFVFGTLIAGNLYKLRDIAVWIMDSLEKPYPELSSKLGFLDGFKWISPLSWINPFEVHDVKVWLILTLA
ncbi:MAG: hypothetical protein K2K09_06100, partial [Lachnospiraceae bacterium]|nr:hypothetical protein [Lachnospiraceae bacterium]